MFDKEYPPIPWPARSDVAAQSGNDWKSCQCSEPDHGVRTGDRHWTYEPGWRLRERVEWYAIAHWREYYASAYGGTYFTAGIKAMWHVFWYRVAIRKLDNSRPAPMWLTRIGAW